MKPGMHFTLKHISVWTSHISSTHKPHVASATILDNIALRTSFMLL